MLTWFDNPPRRGKAKRRTGKKKLYGAAAKAHARAQRRKGAGKMAKRRSRKKLYGAAAAAHAKARRRGGSKRRSSRPRAAARRRTRSYRRTSAQVARRAGRQLRYRRVNPPGLRIIGQLQQGLVDAGFIVGGKAASRIIAGFIPVGAGGMAVNLAVQAGAALAAGYVGRFISPNASRMMLAGGLAGVVESFVKSLNIPLVSNALGDGDIYNPGALAVGAYPQSVPGGVAAYPQLMAGIGDEDDDIYTS